MKLSATFSRYKYIPLLFFICFLSCTVFGQSRKISDSAAVLNKSRIQINDNGMKVLAGWGVVNIVGGGIGLAAAKSTTWRSFYGMNLAWGVINTGIAGMGLLGQRKEMEKQMTPSEMLHSYEATKRLYLINAGLDVLYTGIGVYLTEHSRRPGVKDPHVLRGFGRSFTMQGLFLLGFDNIMFFQHQHSDKKWYRLLSGVAVTGNGIGYNIMCLINSATNYLSASQAQALWL